MLGTKKVKRLIGLPYLVHKTVQYRRMGSHYKFQVVTGVIRDRDAAAPVLILPAEPSVPAFLPYGIGQHPIHPFESKRPQYFPGAVFWQVHPVELLPDTCLDCLFTGNI